MELYRVERGPADFTAGMSLSLTEAQAAPRSHALERTSPLPKAGEKIAADARAEFTVTATVQFKGGEVVGVAGALPKYYLDRLVSATENPAATAGKEEKKMPAKPRPHKKDGGVASKPTPPVSAVSSGKPSRASKPSKPVAASGAGTAKEDKK